MQDIEKLHQLGIPHLIFQWKSPTHYYMDINRHFLYCNSSFIFYYQYNHDSLLGLQPHQRDWHQTIHKHILPWMASSWQVCFAVWLGLCEFSGKHRVLVILKTLLIYAFNKEGLVLIKEGIKTFWRRHLNINYTHSPWKHTMIFWSWGPKLSWLNLIHYSELSIISSIWSKEDVSSLFKCTT